jgi:hypothetical protein
MEFQSCILSELIDPTVSALKAVVDPEFFLRMTL